MVQALKAQCVFEGGDSSGLFGKLQRCWVAVTHSTCFDSVQRNQEQFKQNLWKDAQQ